MTDHAVDHGIENVLAINHPDSDAWIESAFASRYTSGPIPKDKFPPGSMPAPVAYQLIRDMRQLDSNPRLNLASFVTTYMESEAEKLILESANVNYVDMEEYPSSTDIQNRCVAMLADLFHAPGNGLEKSCGTATIGSSEAILLAGLAMKRTWEARRKKEGKPYDKPNLVMGSNVQVCWEKFTRYFDVKENFVMSTEDTYILTPEGAKEQIDENTIGVVGILGSTYTGEFEDIAGLDKVVEEINKKNNWNLGIHVDGASGGFVAPFVYPDLKWDFRLKNVVSINASGHKYGLVYPGVGWVIWRNKDALPEEMVFHTSYLGSDQPSFTLNFSKSASMIVGQYYQFLRLGFSGYKQIMASLLNIAARMQRGLEALDHFKIYSKPGALPLVAFGLKKAKDPKTGEEVDRPYTCFDVADKVRVRGWILPAYALAPNAENHTILRAVIREDLSLSMADELVKDIAKAVEYLDTHFTFSKSEMKAHDARLHVAKHHNSYHNSRSHSHGGRHHNKKFNSGVC